MSKSNNIIDLAKDDGSRSAIFKITVGEEVFDIRAHALPPAIEFVIQELTYQGHLGHPASGWKSKFEIEVECLGSEEPKSWMTAT